MYLINTILLLTLLLRPTYCFLSDTNSTACVRPYYLTGLVCSENCPVGTFGNFDTGLCEECKLAVVLAIDLNVCMVYDDVLLSSQCLITSQQLLMLQPTQYLSIPPYNQELLFLIIL